MKRHLQAEVLRGFEIYHKFELDGRLDGKLARLLSFQNAIGIARGNSKLVALLSSIGKQPANFRKEAPGIYGREAIMRGQQRNFHTMHVQKPSGMRMRPLFGA